MSRLVDSLWAHYKQSGDHRTRDQLIDQYIGLVHQSAREISKRVPKELELAELVSAGTVGLIQALESFEPDRGAAFSSFAVPRIRGAILDEVRRWQWVPRAVRERARRIEHHRRDIEQTQGRPAHNEEIAAALGIDPATLFQWLEQISPPVILTLDSATPGADGRPVRLEERLADSSHEGIDARIDRDETMGRLREAYLTLSSKDRTILSLYYYERLTFRQIGQILRISESRVCQIHARAIDRLRVRLDDQEEVA